MDFKRIIILISGSIILMYCLNLDLLTALAIAIPINYLYNLIWNSNSIFAFREFALFLFSLNYLLSFAIIYIISGDDAAFQGLTHSTYFSLAIPGVILFHLGMYALPNKIFEIDLNEIKLRVVENKGLLLLWLVVGCGLKLASGFIPGDVAFIAYLLGSIRYIAAFSLFIIKPTRYWWCILIVFSLEVLFALREAMFHDVVMWLVFFSIYLIRLYKPSLRLKIGAFFIGVISIIVLQVIKADYRQTIWKEGGEASLSTLGNLAEEKGFLNENAGIAFLNRVNQGWIFASTINNMESTQNFAKSEVIRAYTEAAILPRFLAPNKLNAGSIEIFNKYSGYTISEGTSMALGILADGYLSYGIIGVYIFGFSFGLIFSIVFRIVSNWMMVSPFFLLFILPILSYAVRPDCETQTLLGQVVKGLFLYGLIFWYYKKFFKTPASETFGSEKLNSSFSF